MLREWWEWSRVVRPVFSFRRIRVQWFANFRPYWWRAGLGAPRCCSRPDPGVWNAGRDGKLLPYFLSMQPEWHARKAKEKIRVRCGVRKTGSCDGWFPGRNVHNRGKVPTAHRFAWCSTSAESGPMTSVGWSAVRWREYRLPYPVLCPDSRRLAQRYRVLCLRADTFYRWSPSIAPSLRHAGTRLSDVSGCTLPDIHAPPSPGIRWCFAGTARKSSWCTSCCLHCSRIHWVRLPRAAHTSVGLPRKRLSGSRNGWWRSSLPDRSRRYILYCLLPLKIAWWHTRWCCCGVSLRMWFPIRCGTLLHG